MNSVINFLQNDLLLIPNEQNELPFSTLITKDLNEAEEYAYGQGSHIETVWLDLREKESFIVSHATDEDFDFWDDNGNTLIEKQLTKLNLDIENDIDADLFNCYLNEKYSLKSIFWENVLTAYLNGYWPCGWHGVYPTGKLVLFKKS